MIEILRHIQTNYVPQVALEDGTIEVCLIDSEYQGAVITSIIIRNNIKIQIWESKIMKFYMKNI